MLSILKLIYFVQNNLPKLNRVLHHEMLSSISFSFLGEDGSTDNFKTKEQKIQDITPKKTQINTADDLDLKIALNNTMMLLENSKICPFRWMKNLYLCFYCDRQFSDPAELRKHNSVEHANQTAKEILNALAKLQKYELVKVDVNDAGCKICNEPIATLASLKAHLSNHGKKLNLEAHNGILPFKVSKDDFKCALCAEKYEDFKSLNHHMNVHFQNFICEQCGTGFVTQKRLKTHLLSHGTGSFPCQSCNKIFRSSNAKNEHYATVHKKVKRHRCPHCTETFRNYFQRNKHISAVHGIKLKEFKCNMCPKVFTISGKLGVHIQTVHLKMKRHNCEVCERKFYSKLGLKEHMVRHGGQSEFQCSVCKKVYARKYTLREHMRIHENDRRFVCTICGRTFVQNCHLKLHSKIHQPKTEPVAKFSKLVPHTIS